MRSAIIIAAVASLATAGTSFAQYGATPQGATPPPPTQLEPAPSAGGKSALPNAGPAQTETQAKSRIEEAGYTRVSELKRKEGSTSEWSAKAMKNGKPVQLSLDVRGRVTELN
jgi:hypothetical protein